MNYPKEFLLNLYAELLKARKVEEHFVNLYARGKIQGNVHSGIGEEAVFVGGCATLLEKDYLLPTHRGVIGVVARGIDLKSVFCDAFGKVEGTNKGRGGMIRTCSKEKGVLGISGTLGGVFVLAAGAGLSSQVLQEDKVVLAFFGDGTTNRGTFHESLNLASVWKLPVVFVCDNNQFGISAHISKVMSVDNVADRASAYGMPGEIVDGNSVLDVYESVKKGVDRARRGEGPSLIEAKTYRIRGHYEGDPTPYRSKEDVKEWMEKCPVKRFQQELLEKGILDQNLIEEINEKLDAEIDKAIQEADEAKQPDPAEVFDGLFA